MSSIFTWSRAAARLRRRQPDRPPTRASARRATSDEQGQRGQRGHRQVQLLGQAAGVEQRGKKIRQRGLFPGQRRGSLRVAHQPAARRRRRASDRRAAPAAPRPGSPRRASPRAAAGTGRGARPADHERRGDGRERRLHRVGERDAAADSRTAPNGLTKPANRMRPDSYIAGAAAGGGEKVAPGLPAEQRQRCEHQRRDRAPAAAKRRASAPPRPAPAASAARNAACSRARRSRIPATTGRRSTSRVAPPNSAALRNAFWPSPIFQNTAGKREQREQGGAARVVEDAAGDGEIEQQGSPPRKR